MSIGHTLLGFLSWKPLSGYDLKKLVSETPFLHWSGNNNQIYKALVRLHQDGLVSLEVQNQPSGPSRKVYSLTGEGLGELKRWLRSSPDLPESRTPLLAQLAWADLLGPGELDGLLSGYEAELHAQLLTHREHQRRMTADSARPKTAPARTERERLLWGAILEHRVLAYETELNWLRELKRELTSRPASPQGRKGGKR